MAARERQAFLALRVPINMSEPTSPGDSGRFVPLAIVGLAVLYALALAAGWPQYGTQAIVGQQAHHAEAADAPTARRTRRSRPSKRRRSGR